MPHNESTNCLPPLRLPTVTLDTTLTDLYRSASPDLSDKHVAQVLAEVNSRAALTAKVPRNAKFIYQDSIFNETQLERDTSRAGLRARAAKYLALIPQRDAFVAGCGTVVMFDLNEASAHRDRDETERTMSVLDDSQRPEIIFRPGPADISVRKLGADFISSKLVLDAFEHLPLLVPTDVHWFLNSKAALAQSGLPTPACEIVEIEGYCGEAALCCRKCQRSTSTDGFEVPALCEGPRAKWVEEQSARVYSAVGNRRLPFVFKYQQTLSGGGTWLISTEEDRAWLFAILQNGMLRRVLSSITRSNYHLKPGTIILSEMVAEPVGNYAITFFVTADETKPIFLATSEQVLDGTAWIGNVIRYDRQEKLKAKFFPLVKLVARWLSQYNYIGPAGIDVLETAEHTYACGGGNYHYQGGGRGAFPHFHVVDLNVRITGALPLSLLRGHFERRGMHSASSFPISTNKRRHEFVNLFRDDFEAGNMLILGYFEDRDTVGKVSSLAFIAVGAQNSRALKDAIQRVRDVTDEITF